MMMMMMMVMMEMMMMMMVVMMMVVVVMVIKLSAILKLVSTFKYYRLLLKSSVMGSDPVCLVHGMSQWSSND